MAREDTAVAVTGCLVLLGWLAFWGAIIFIGIHFAAKYW